MSLTAKLVLTPLLLAQAVRTRSRLPKLPEAEGEREGAVGSGPALKLLIAGDSSAAGVGVLHQREALAGQMTAMLAADCGARIEWRLIAQAGLNTAQTHERLLSLALAHYDVAVIVTGVNDLIDQVPSHHAVSQRESIANWLRNAVGVHHVVFAPMPPVHEFPGLPQPLRWIAGSDARRHDRATADWAATRSDVSRVEMELSVNRGVMASDGFHPGEPVYRQSAAAISRHIATRVWPQIVMAGVRA